MDLSLDVLQFALLAPSWKYYILSAQRWYSENEIGSGSAGLKEASLHGSFRVGVNVSVWVERKKA